MPNGKKLLRSLAAVITGVSVLFAAGCATSSTYEDGLLNYVEPNMFNSLYPPSGGYYPNGGVLNNIADRLLYQDPETMELSPWIAEELPEINEDATEFTFRIRQGVTYSDGSVLDAYNVARNYELYGKGDPDRTLTPSDQLAGFEHAEVLDDYTVRFHFSQSAPGFPQSTSAMNQALLSDETLELDNAGFSPGNATAISGSGPFYIADETLGTELVLKAREDYDWAPPEREDHQGASELPGVRLILAAEDSVRVGSLVAGQSDIARQVEAPDEKHLLNQRIGIHASGTNGVNNAFHFHFRHPLLSDVEVREAIIHAIDRENIVRTLFSESYPMGTSLLAETAPGHRDQSDHYVHDPELSRQLLDEAGWQPGPDGIRVKNGQRLSVTFNEAVPQPRSREMITKVQEMLHDVGVEIHLNPGDRTAQQQAMTQIDVVQVRHSMVGRANLDALPNWLDGDNRNSLLNRDTEDGSLGDETLQTMIEDYYGLVGREDREEAVGEIQDYVSEQAYVLPIFEEPQVYGYRNHVEGFTTEAIGRPSFYAVSLHD